MNIRAISSAFVFVGLCLLVSVGCGPLTVPSVDSKQKKSESVWTVLADYVAAEEITNSTKLELIIKRLRSHGDIDDTAIDRFYAAFPGFRAKDMPVTKSDADILRGL